MTEKEACELWVHRDMSQIPESVVVKLANASERDMLEVTPWDEDDPDPYYEFPAWGTMWAFDDICDIEWCQGHLEEMKECGFRIYESEDWEYVFGINGGGYDFYEAHWIPLYRARGLKWHDEITEE